MKIATVVGTRPEIIKCAPVIRAIEQTKETELLLIHSGQHYSADMDTRIFEDLALSKPHYNLEVGSGSHARQTGDIMARIEAVFEAEKPDYVLVQGDTNTVLAAALTAAKLHVPFGHIEAGLRSYDRAMPEEINRIVADHIADDLFAPTQLTAEILESEGIDKDRVLVTGNTIVDSVFQNLEIAEANTRARKLADSMGSKSIYVTAHRAENVDDKRKLSQILEAFTAVSNSLGFTLVWPMHPRTRSRIDEFGLAGMLRHIRNLTVVGPVGFLESLNLEHKSALVMTDSGGLQEEACILGTPCITLRENTERPETVAVGANTLVGTSPSRIIDAVTQAAAKHNQHWTNPFGDGTSSRRIIDHLLTSPKYSDSTVSTPINVKQGA